MTPLYIQNTAFLMTEGRVVELDTILLNTRQIIDLRWPDTQGNLGAEKLFGEEKTGTDMTKMLSFCI